MQPFNLESKQASASKYKQTKTKKSHGKVIMKASKLIARSLPNAETR